jgi:hypothetical protein
LQNLLASFYCLRRGFARCLLEGGVLPYFKDIIQHLCDRPSSLSKQVCALDMLCSAAAPRLSVPIVKRVGQWLSPNAAALVEVLLIARVASLSALRQQWEQQPKWLLPQILPWYARTAPHDIDCFSFSPQLQC